MMRRLISVCVVLAVISVVLTACERSTVHSYEGVLSSMADEFRGVTSLVDSIQTREDAEGARAEIAQAVSDLKALTEQAKGLDAVQPEDYDKLVDMAKPTDAAQVALREAITRLSNERTPAAAAIVDDLRDLDNATGQALLAIEIPTRSAQMDAMLERARDLDKPSARDELEIGSQVAPSGRFGRDRSPRGGGYQPKSVDEYRKEMEQEHGTDHVVLIEFVEWSPEYALGELSKVAKQRLGASTHAAQGGSSEARMVLAPVRGDLGEVGKRLDMGEVLEADLGNRILKIRFDPARYAPSGN